MPTKNYTPDDAHLIEGSLQFLRTSEGSALRTAIKELPDSAHPTVAEVTRLRKEFPADAVAVALTLGAIQEKAEEKFPDIPYLWSPPEALEQATSSRVARHKASRFAAALACAKGPVFDLCAGIGGDTLALADIAPVAAVDLSPIRAACLAYNRDDRVPPPQHPIAIRIADVRTLQPADLKGALVHVDPARRSAGKRSPRYEDLIPGPDTLDFLMKHAAGMAIKLSPAVDFDSLPPGHLELISENGSVVQAVLWTGQLQFAPRDQRTATMVDKSTWSFTATSEPAEIFDLPAPERDWLPPLRDLWLYELDGTLTRSGLASPFCQHHGLNPISADGGYALSPKRIDLLPATTCFKVIATCPYSERHVASILPRLSGPGSPATVEVKTRGKIPGVDTDRLQVAWSKVASLACTVLIFHYRQEPIAIIATRET